MTTSTMSSAVAERVARLRTLAETDPQAAQDAAWAWFTRIGAQLPDHAAELELAQLFAAGDVADIDGQTEGKLVGFLNPTDDLQRTGRVIITLGKVVTGTLGLMPWLGKKFDKSARRGTNTLSGLAFILAAVLAPKYRLRRNGSHWEGFEMLNRVEPSVVSPQTQVLVLDYETIGTNPWPINQIRDEAVQIVAGTYLGAKLLHQESGYRQLAYWAARVPVA